MSDAIRIELPEDPPAYEPRDELVGTLTWKRAKPYSKIELHLFWYTMGKGDEDSSIVETLEWTNPGAEGDRFFEIRLPRAPYSLRSDNLEIRWCLEAVGHPGKERAVVDLLIAPGGRRLELKTVEDERKKFRKWFDVQFS